MGCSPPSCSPGRGEALEEPSGEAVACCAPAVQYFPSYTAQLAGCLHRPELILAALCFPLLPSRLPFPRRLPTMRPPTLLATLRGGGEVRTWVAHTDPLPTSLCFLQFVPQFPQMAGALPRLFHGVCSLATVTTLTSPGTSG